tara:strand:- start:1550 stop:1678 length:129 start_codon:yes stop_codon:yes gene_type:complete
MGYIVAGSVGSSFSDGITEILFFNKTFVTIVKGCNIKLLISK